LVCENDRGGILGFIGVSARRLRWQGAEVCAAVSHGLMVDPESRGVTGLRLLQRLLDGPLDITFADSPNQVARRLMEHLGGVTAPHDSLFWVRPLRPVRYMLGQIRNGGLLFSARLLARPVASAIDALAARYAHSPFYLKDPGSREEPLTASDLVRCLSELGSVCSPTPSYSEAALSWLLGSLGRGPQAGALRQALVRSSACEEKGVPGAERTASRSCLPLARRGRAARTSTRAGWRYRGSSRPEYAGSRSSDPCPASTT